MWLKTLRTTLSKMMTFFFIDSSLIFFNVQWLLHLWVIPFINKSCTIVTSTDHLMTKWNKMNPQCTAGIVKLCSRWQNSRLKLMVFIHRFKNFKKFSCSFLLFVVCSSTCWVILSFPVAQGLWSQRTCKACVRMSQTAF